MSALKIFLFGPPRVELDGAAIDIKRRKAMAMLVYLAVTGQPHSRDALATLFYPDHSQSRARAYLRRDLAVLNTALDSGWLDADRETIELKPGFWADVTRFRELVAARQQHPHLPNVVCPACVDLLREAVTLYTGHFLAGFTLRDCPEFDEWQFFQSESQQQALALALEQLVAGFCYQKTYEAAIPHARRWVALDPLHEPAQRRLIELYDQAGQPSAALRQYEEYAALLEEELGLPPEEETLTLYEAIKAKRLLGAFLKAKSRDQDDAEPAQPPGPKASTPSPTLPAPTPVTPTPSPSFEKKLPAKVTQEIRFCTAPDGVRLAYATVGQGPVLVKASNWLTHLEYDWDSPVWRHWLLGLARQHRLVRYDRRGCGLSDWDAADFSLDAYVADMEAVVDALGLERFPLLGLSGGGPVAIAYAARHPERVSHLILYGSYVLGRLKRGQDQAQRTEARMMLQMMELGWGKDNPAFRQVYTSLFIPEGTAEQISWFNDLQRVSTSPEVAVRLFSASYAIDASAEARQVAVPTLILHAHDDAVVPFEEGRRLAALIPAARFVPLAGKNHILLEDEPAWPQFLAEVHQFLQADGNGQTAPPRVVAAAPVVAPAPAPLPAHNLPPQPTEFLGRETELAEIQRRLAGEPNCRLLTLVGPGGIGKTRLAVEAATRLLPGFSDGVYFAPLAAITEPEFIETALAEALDFNFHGAAEPKQQLFDHLKDKSLLLVLDNFEQLLSNPRRDALPGGETLLAELLAHAPRLRLLVTSRERLKLREEWGFDVRGMPFPAAGQPAAASLTRLEQYAAVQLFVRSAARVAPGYQLMDADASHIARICQLVDGMPLGIELAAPWLRLISTGEIAAEIERSLDFLTTTLHNVPERHRSIKAVFHQTWQRLPAAEQTVLSQLSVFKGGCLRPAAEFVTGATLPVLGELVDRALLHRTPAGRFDMHELIRQFAEEQLNRDAALADAARQRHSEFYTRLLRDTTAAIKGAHQRRALNDIETDLDNFRAAWRWAVAHQQVEALLPAAECFWLFHEFRGLLHEGQALFGQTVDALRPVLEGDSSAAAQTLLGFLQAGQGSLAGRSGNLDEGCRLMGQGIGLMQQAEPPDRQKEEFALAWQAFILMMHGRYAEAKAAAEASLALFPQTGDHWSKAGCLRLLGASTLLRGQLDEAEQLLQSCVVECLEIGERRIRTYATINLGQIALYRGQVDEARQQLDRAFEITQVLGDRLSRADTLREQGRLALTQGDYAAAARLIEDSLALYREIGRRDVGAALSYLGTVACVQGHHAAAEQTFHQGLDISRRVAHQADIAANLGGLGRLALARGQHHQAEQYLGEALDIWQRIGNEPALAAVLCDLGLVAAEAEAGRQSEARDHWRRALELIKKHRLAPLALELFVRLARLLIAARQVRSAIELLALAEYHSASSEQTRQQARRILAELASNVTGEAMASGKASGQKLDWLTLADHLRGELARPGGNVGVPAAALGAGQNRFIEETLIAAGGMGQVYRGRDTRSGQPVAIKRLRPELVSGNPEVVSRFRREAETLRRLDHPNIVKILDSYEDEGQPVIVLEYVAGGTLQDLLAETPQLPLERVLSIGLELADALARVHHLGILHRDIKPGNVLLTEDGAPRLTDFGVAYLAHHDMQLTREGSILGTTVYLSPEAWRGEKLDARSDIWSFGAMLFEMLAGQPPFFAENPVAIMTAILNDPLPNLRRFRADAPPALVALIEQMLVKDRHQRCDSMRQIAAALEIIGR